MNIRKTARLFSAAAVMILLSSCADFWFDLRNKDNPPPLTPAVDEPAGRDPAVSVVLLTDDQLTASATQSLIMALSKKGMTGIELGSPQNSIYADRIYRALLEENIVKMGGEYVLNVSAPAADGMEVVISKEIGGTPIIRVMAKRRR